MEGGYRHASAWTLAAVAFLAAALAGAQWYGTSRRVFASPPAVAEVSGPAAAALAWRQRGLRGRVLVLFDHYPHADVGEGLQTGEPRSPESLVDYGVFHGMLRRVYLVVPDDRWDEFRRQEGLYKILRPAPGLSQGVELFTFSGVPMIALPTSALPRLDEPALVYVNGRVFDAAWVPDLLRRRGIVSDLLLTWPGDAGG